MIEFFKVFLPDYLLAIEVKETRRAMGGHETTWGYYIGGKRLDPDPRTGAYAAHAPIEGIISRESIPNAAALLSKLLS
ncbi:hypothetical protein LCGC14_1744220 [marine sediment metagenome]|uniref:Uncharacterized protein n=1 Tax=marine sediment metagenome TaxID=412755 RepID=A0A0F9JL23_9ZZZZ